MLRQGGHFFALVAYFPSRYCNQYLAKNRIYPLGFDLLHSISRRILPLLRDPESAAFVL
jgi:alpha-D-ribose 1-methylphosphonate 5-triphosphate synthase subunit PhnH